MVAITEEQLRASIKLIKSFGVTNRHLADRLNVSESWLSRWLEQPEGIKVRPMSVPEMNRFQAYIREMTAALQETQRVGSSSPSASSSTAAGMLQRSGNRRHADLGPPPGIAEDRRKRTG